MTPVEGALLEPLGVAIHTVDLAKLRVGETVAVLGAGSIGLLTATMAQSAGAGAIYMSEPLAYRRDFAQRYIGGHGIRLCAALHRGPRHSLRDLRPHRR